MQVPHNEMAFRISGDATDGGDPAAAMQVPANRTPSSGVEQQRTPAKYVSVKPGDTLWSIAQKYHVNVNVCGRSIN